MTETQIQSEILAVLGSHPNIRMFRNFVGEGFVGSPPHRLRRVSFGLAVGSADLIGFTTVIIEPKDVGRKVAVFTSVEVKRPKDYVISDAQAAWKDMVNDRGGHAIIAHSPKEALNSIMDI